MTRTPWAIAYRPSSVKDFLFQDEGTKALVTKFVEEKNIPHLLLAGHHGTGKSSLVNVLKHELEIDDLDYLYINASLNNSIDDIRTKVYSFVNTFSVSGFKLVYLDEADRLSSNAQDALKSMTEDYADNARFIFTCNKPHKIVVELRSRCQEIIFKSLSKDDMFQKAAKILKKENVKLDDAALDIIEKYVDATAPDFRKLINTLQQNVINGELVEREVEAAGATETNVTMLEMMETNQWAKIRGYVAAHTSDDAWEDTYRFLYQYIGEVSAFTEDARKTEEAIITIADHLYKHNFMADAEINFAACIIKLSRIAKR